MGRYPFVCAYRRYLKGVRARLSESTMAELERGLIRDCMKTGLARVRAEGRRLGGPRKNADIGRILELQAQGWGCNRIGTALGVSHQTTRNRLKEAQKNEGANGTNETP